MPNAVLAAVVFLIGLRLIDYKGMADIYRLRKGEFAVAAITAATVVIVGVEQGIILAMALSIVEHIYHSYRPYDTLLAPRSTTARSTRRPWRMAPSSLPGLAVYRFGASLYYANASRFTEEIMDLVEDADPPLRWLALVGSAMADVDYSGADSMRQVHEELERKNVTLVLADLSPEVRSQLDAYGLTEQIGEGNIYASIRELEAAYGRLGPLADAKADRRRAASAGPSTS